MGPSTVGMLNLKHNPRISHYSSDNLAIDAGISTGIVAGTVWYLYEAVTTIATTSSTTGMLSGIGLAAGGYLISPFVGIGVFVGAQYSKNYLTRYPQNEDVVLSSVHKLQRLHQAGQMMRLRQYIVNQYQPGWFTSKHSSQLYNNLKNCNAATDVFNKIVDYLSQQDKSHNYYNNGKRLFNLILNWVRCENEQTIAVAPAARFFQRPVGHIPQPVQQTQPNYQSPQQYCSF